MARPKSEDKRNAILDAATAYLRSAVLPLPQRRRYRIRLASPGGALFTYFRTKDDLVNTLYREIKLELADAMVSGFPRRKSLRTRLRHV